MHIPISPPPTNPPRSLVLHTSPSTRSLTTTTTTHGYPTPGSSCVTITVRTPALCLLDTSDKSFLYAYHIRYSPYARFVRTTSLPYLYRSLSVTFVLHMVPSLSRIRYYPLFTNTYVPLYLHVYKPMYLDVEP